MATAHYYKHLVARYFAEVLNQAQLATLEALIADNYVVHDPGLPGRPDGIEGAKRTLRLYRNAFPDMQYAIEAMVAEGEQVVVRWRATGTHRGEWFGIPPTGQAGTIEGISMFRFVNDKLVEQWTNWDTMGLLTQLGVVPLLPERLRHPAW